jgi:hypothetical protein
MGRIQIATKGNHNHTKTYQDAALGHSVLKLVALDDLVLLQNFERVLLVSVFLRDQQHFAVAALPNHRIGDKVSGCHFARLCLLVGDNLFVILDFILELHLHRSHVR